MGHRRAPGMKHGGDADAGAEVLRIGGDRDHRLGGGTEQQIVDHDLVLVGDIGDLGRQREDDVEVADPARDRLGARQASPVPPRPGIWGNAGCGRSCRRCGCGRSPRTPRHGRPALRYGSSRSRTLPSSGPGSDGRHGLRARRRHGGGRCRQPPTTGGSPPPHQASGRVSSVSSLIRSSGLITLRIVLVATRA